MDARVPPKPAHLVRNPTRGWHRIDRSCGNSYTSRIVLNDSFHAKTSGKSSTNRDKKKKAIKKFENLGPVYITVSILMTEETNLI